MSIRKLVFGAVLAAVVAMVPVRAHAATIQLGFILDRSGSIGSSSWTTIVNGLSTAVNSFIPVGGADTYEVSVVAFDQNATIAVANFLVTDAAARTALATQIAAIPFTGGTTDYADAFAAMQNALDNTIAGAAFSYVNFATDGAPDNNTTGIAARNALIAIGIDNISVEGIGVNTTTAANLIDNYCYPGPCDTTAPYNFPAQGFYIGVANAQGYADAIGNKIQVVTQNPVVPEPGTWTLMCLGLAGVVAARRRARKNQN